MACVSRRGCERVLVCGSTRFCPRPRLGWIRVWVDRLPGGCPNGREGESERARSRAARSAGSSVCVSQALWLSTGAAWHPQECGFTRLPRPSPVPQGGGRQEKGGKRAEISLAQHELKQRPIYLIFHRRAQEAGRARRNRTGPASMPRVSWALRGGGKVGVEAWEYGVGRKVKRPTEKKIKSWGWG